MFINDRTAANITKLFKALFTLWSNKLVCFNICNYFLQVRLFEELALLCSERSHSAVKVFIFGTR
jgi:hypothetical protein